MSVVVSGIKEKRYIKLFSLRLNCVLGFGNGWLSVVYVNNWTMYRLYLYIVYVE